MDYIVITSLIILFILILIGLYLAHTAPEYEKGRLDPREQYSIGIFMALMSWMVLIMNTHFQFDMICLLQ